MRQTANERIITRLRQPYPRWHVGTSFGRDYHKLASRVSDLNAKGLGILSRKSKKHFHASGRAEQEYRMNSLA